MSIVTIGEILVEMVADQTGQKFNETGLFHGPFPSGAPAIFIDQASKCGSVSKMISTVGDDGFGEININRLKEDGVDTSMIAISNHKSTGVAFVTYRPDGDRDFIFHIADSAAGDISVNKTSENGLADCSYFHIMGSSVYNKEIQNAIKHCFNILPYESKISFDPNVRKEILDNSEKLIFLQDVLKKSHIVLASLEELRYLMGDLPLSNILEILFNEYVAEVVVIKSGKKGSTVYTKEKEIDIPAFEVEELDPTGAGDCFAGTFVSLLNQGVTLEEAAIKASAAGALAVTKVGPMEGNTTLNELDAFISSYR